MKISKYPVEIIQQVLLEFDECRNKKFLSRKFKIPRGTIQYWINNPRILDKTKENLIDLLNSVDKSAYSYILGVYLGDGNIDKMTKTYRLRIALNINQDLVIDECYKNLKMLLPKNKISFNKQKNSNCGVISIYSNLLPILFPHLGNGRKHDRKIELTDEQLKIINKNVLMKGLFHTDGSFYLASNKYPRYQFTNKSKDIIDIFSDCLLNVNVRPKIRQKKDGIYNINIQNKPEVMILYYILGEKYKTPRYKNIKIERRKKLETL